MPKYVFRQISLEPIVEYHVVTPTGVTCSIYDNEQRAIDSLATNNHGRVLLKVTVTREDITPFQMAQPSQIALSA